MKKIFVASIIVVLLIGNLYFIYWLLDRAAFEDDLKSQLDYVNKRSELLRTVSMDIACPRTKDEISSLLKSKYSGHLIKPEDGILWLEEVGFAFKNDTLSNIVFNGE